ncbi:MAG: hypothetical protein IKV21_00835, partial [Clostridia bacterium]|nr:hypothetical protein [Clostridia bacterium]
GSGKTKKAKIKRQFPVCDPATGRPQGKVVVFESEIKIDGDLCYVAVMKRVKPFPAPKRGRFVYFVALGRQSKSPSGLSDDD